MRVQLELCIDFVAPIRLTEVGTRRTAFPRRGVYLIAECESEEAARKVTPLDSSVIYIGQANGEPMSTRCQKHLWSVQDVRLTSGEPRTRPGAAFKRYRESIGLDPTNLWVLPGVMGEDKPYLISCAEEYLLFEYARLHGRLPLANTAW